MTDQELRKLVEDAVRIGVREALQAEQQKKDDAEREKALAKTVEGAVAKAFGGLENADGVNGEGWF